MSILNATATKQKQKKIPLPIECAFYFCSSLTSITIPDSVTSIGQYAFDQCSLESLDLPSNITNIGKYSFAGNDFKSITIPNGVKSIDGAAFDGCYKLESVVIPKSVTVVSELAFYRCSSLTIVYYGGTANDWKNISIDDYDNEMFIDATRYYYSATKPTTSGNFWHYDTDGVTPVVWHINDVDSDIDKSNPPVSQITSTGVWLVGEAIPSDIYGDKWDIGVQFTQEGDVWVLYMTVYGGGGMWLKVRDGGLSDEEGNGMLFNTESNIAYNESDDFEGYNIIINTPGRYKFTYNGEATTIEAL